MLTIDSEFPRPPEGGVPTTEPETLLDRVAKARSEAGSEENFAKLRATYAGAISTIRDVDPDDRVARAFDAICGQLVEAAANDSLDEGRLKSEGAAIVYMARAIGELAELAALEVALND